MQATLKKIWGIEYEEIYIDGMSIWRFNIKNPFFTGGWKIGLNEKFLKEAIASGVGKLIAVVGQRDIPMWVPTAKELKRKNKANEFEDMPSLFKGSPDMRIYHFRL